MIKFATFAAKNPLIIGLIVGLMAFGWFPTAMAQTSPPNEACNHPSTWGNIESYDQQIRPFATVQVELQSRLFEDELAPSSGYALTKRVDQVASYECIDVHQRVITFHAVSVRGINLHKANAVQFQDGEFCSVAFGVLEYDGRKVPISALNYSLRASHGTGEGSHLVVLTVMTEADLSLYAQSERLLAGPRVVNALTGQSSLLSQLTGSRALFANESDLATLYAADPGNQAPVVALSCVDIAYRRYAAAQRAAKENLDTCIVEAMVEFAVCAGLCAAGAIFAFPLCPLIATACGSACLLIEANQIAACASNYNTAVRLNLANLKLDLEACGVVMAQE